MLAMLTLLAACGAGSLEGGASSPSAVGPQTDRPLPTASLPPDVSTEPMPSQPIAGAVPEDLLSQILADAADRSGLPIDELEIVVADSVTFNDGSLGCPQPGMAYTQALVDGYRVVVAAAGEEFDYRAARAGGFIYCENPTDNGTSNE